MRSFSDEASSPRLHNLKESRERIATEIATTRCCSWERNSAPVSSRRFRNMICPTCSSDTSPRPYSRRPRSVSGTVSMSKTRVFMTERRINIATATTSPASSVSVTCPSPMPRSSRTRAPRSEYTTSGRPQEFCTMPTSRIHTPWANPVPMPLTIASLAANRIARNRTGRAVRPSWARSSGIRRWARNRSPCLLNTCSIRSTFNTSIPIPKIIATLERAPRRAHQFLHGADRRGQTLEERARHDGVADVQLHDLGDCGDRFDVVIVETVAGVDRQSRGRPPASPPSADARIPPPVPRLRHSRKRRCAVRSPERPPGARPRSAGRRDR